MPMSQPRKYSKPSSEQPPLMMYAAPQRSLRRDSARRRSNTLADRIALAEKEQTPFADLLLIIVQSGATLDRAPRAALPYGIVFNQRRKARGARSPVLPTPPDTLLESRVRVKPGAGCPCSITP